MNLHIEIRDFVFYVKHPENARMSYSLFPDPFDTYPAAEAALKAYFETRGKVDKGWTIEGVVTYEVT